MRIFSVFFHPSSNFTAVGGAEKRFVEILKAWNRLAVTVTVVDSDPRLIESRGKISCEMIRMPSPITASGKGLFSIYLEWILWIVKACLFCPSLVKREQYDIILAPNNTFPNLAVAYFLHIMSGIPLCVTVHHLDFPNVDTHANLASSYSIYRRVRFSIPVAFTKAVAFSLTLALLKSSDACITVSNYTSNLLVRNGLPEQKVHVSGNGIDTELIDHVQTPPCKMYDGVFVGRIARDKGVFDLVEIWKQIVANNDKARLLVIGTGPDLLKLKEAVEDSGLVSQITLVRANSDNKLYSLMKASKVFLFPSIFEGWGLAVGEALACGLPVVCYNIPALLEIFGDCKSVYFVPASYKHSFATTLQRILETEDFDKFEILSKAYVGRFGWHEIALKDLQIMSSSLSQRKRT